MERVDGLHIRPLHACVPPSAVEPLLGVFKIASRTALTASNAVVAIIARICCRTTIMIVSCILVVFYAVKIAVLLFQMHAARLVWPLPLPAY